MKSDVIVNILVIFTYVHATLGMLIAWVGNFKITSKIDEGGKTLVIKSTTRIKQGGFVVKIYTSFLK